MNRAVEFFKANPVQYLATVGRDGKAKCRPFMFCFEKEGRLWFCTNSQKDVYKDMQANPEIEVCVSDSVDCFVISVSAADTVPEIRLSAAAAASIHLAFLKQNRFLLSFFISLSSFRHLR